jgi:hypothetical protein
MEEERREMKKTVGQLAALVGALLLAYGIVYGVDGLLGNRDRAPDEGPSVGSVARRTTGSCESARR